MTNFPRGPMLKHMDEIEKVYQEVLLPLNQANAISVALASVTTMATDNILLEFS